MAISRQVAFETERLYLQQWQDAGLLVFARLNADPQVMAYIPALLSKTESDSLAKRLELLIQKCG